MITRRQLFVGAAAAATSRTLFGPAPASHAVKRTRPISSRAWISLTMDLVRTERPTPPAAARLYAYVASTYADVRAIGNERQASEATRQVLGRLLPHRAAEVDALAPIVSFHPTSLDLRSQQLVSGVLARIEIDGYQPDDPVSDLASAPSGEGHWKRTNAGPFAPTAGTWKRWLVSGAEFSVPDPITRRDGTAYEKQKQQVINATARRDAEWAATINFWGGVPGTESPAGIWLNRLWDVVGKASLGSNDRQYARVQTVLAMAIADSFMECWKVKYRYWTERPDMCIPGLSTAMDNPPFPSYVSGHSTISSTAATVLGAMLPAHRSLWSNDAASARDSRLYAGIHFPMDNEQGFKLGAAVGAEVLRRTTVKSSL